ncbi:hypothetical protein Hanom_Chr04g00368531 [Helianthus anomalus]
MFQTLNESKLPKSSMRFGHFWHFSPKLKHFTSGSLWFQFCCHFHPKSKSGQIVQSTSSFFFFFLSISFLLMMGKMVF